jgi:hypothetical protein
VRRRQGQPHSVTLEQTQQQPHPPESPPAHSGTGVPDSLH